MKTLTVICPCYNEKDNVEPFYQEVLKNEEFFSGKGVELKFLFVDDGSHDGTLDEIKKLSSADKRVHYLSFSRNFGKEAAMYAGLEHAGSEFVVIMDVDLQDPPHRLPEMFSYLEEGYDSVSTRRVNRKGEPLKGDSCWCRGPSGTDRPRPHSGESRSMHRRQIVYGTAITDALKLTDFFICIRNLIWLRCAQGA